MDEEKPLKFVLKYIQTARSFISTPTKKIFAILWARFYRTQYSFAALRHKYSQSFALLTLVSLLALSALTIPILDETIASNLASETNVQLLRSSINSLGGALFGASAIVASLVLFAVQVNIERMPHGLFKRFGSDSLLLCAFASSFGLSSVILLLPLIPIPRFGGIVVWACFCSTILILVLYLYAYKRALALVNPAKQLNLIVEAANRNANRTLRRANRARPIINIPESATPLNFPNQLEEELIDWKKTVYLRINEDWVLPSENGVTYAITYARRFADLGDHEVSRKALASICEIFACYIEVRKDTFIGSDALVALLTHGQENSDRLLNHALEQMRQLAAHAIAKNDETLLEQVIDTLAVLVTLLSSINYFGTTNSKNGARLACHYLSSTLEQTLTKGLADVLMHGIRKLGASARVLIAENDIHSGISAVEKIATLTAATIIKAELNPVTRTGVSEIATSSFLLLFTKNNEIRFAAEDVRKNMKLVSTIVLATTDKGLLGSHSSILSPYYSASSSSSLFWRLRTLFEEIQERASDDEEAKRIISNFADWTDQIYIEEKEIFLLALEKKSKFSFDHFNWLSNLTKVIMVASTAKVTNEHTQRHLTRNAIWLISIIDWVPPQKEVIDFLESYQATDELVDLSVFAKKHGCFEVASKVDKLLFEWAIKAGYLNGDKRGWDILEKSILGLILSSQLDDPFFSNFNLEHEFKEKLSQATTQQKDVLKSAVVALSEQSDNLSNISHRGSRLFAITQTSKCDEAVVAIDSLCTLFST